MHAANCDEADLREDNVLGVGSTLLSDAVHEGLGGQPGGLRGSQTLRHAVDIHILVEGVLQISTAVDDCAIMTDTSLIYMRVGDIWQFTNIPAKMIGESQPILPQRLIKSYPQYCRRC